MARLGLTLSISSAVYFGIIALLASSPRIQALGIYAHWVRAPWVDLTDLRRFHLAGWARNIEVKTKDGEMLRGWHVVPGGGEAIDEAMNVGYDTVLRKPGERVLVYFHGNALTRGYTNRVERVKAISAHAHAHVVVVDYRGFGGSTGYPSEEGVAEDARAVMRWVRERVHVSSKVFLYGQSLGSGVAVRLASEMCTGRLGGNGIELEADALGGWGCPDGLILDSAYRTMVDASTTHPIALPFRLIPVVSRFLQSRIVDRWDSISRVEFVHCPVLIVHGEKDRKIPIDQGRALLDAARASRALTSQESIDGQELPGHRFVFWVPFEDSGHSNIQSSPRFGHQIASFIRSIDSGSKDFEAADSETCGIRCRAERQLRGLHGAILSRIESAGSKNVETAETKTCGVRCRAERKLRDLQETILDKLEATRQSL